MLGIGLGALYVLGNCITTESSAPPTILNTDSVQAEAPSAELWSCSLLSL